MIDRSTTLAISMVTTPGAYAFLVGSGVSRGSAIPTGWEVLGDLIVRLATAEGAQAPGDPFPWYEDKFGKPATYPDVLEGLASRPVERQALLKGYFEPTAADRESGVKVPTAAHRALADLARRGLVKLILTTNFDRLVELALADAGVTPTVISGPEAAESAVPTAFTTCTVVKLHGDYLDSRLLNTEAELASYDERIQSLLDRLLDDHGLVVVGWSGTWDRALRDAIIAKGVRRYSTYWVQRGEISSDGQAVVEATQAAVIRAPDAAAFLTRLAEQTESLAALAGSAGISSRTAVATAKRLVTRHEDRIRLEDLLSEQSRESLSLVQPINEKGGTGIDFVALVNQVQSAAAGMCGVIGTIAKWGETSTIGLIPRLLTRLARQPIISGYTAFLTLRRFPAALAFYAAGTVLVHAERYESLHRVFQTALDIDGETFPAFDQLHLQAVLDWRAIEAADLVNGTQRRTPLSDRVMSFLDGALEDVISTSEERDRSFEVFELMLSAFSTIAGRGPIAGRYTWRGGFRDDEILRQALADERSEPAGWPPVAAGLFPSVEAFREAVATSYTTYRGIRFS